MRALMRLGGRASATISYGAIAVLMACAAAWPTTAMAQRTVITGGTVHTLAGDPIVNGTVVMEGGRITAVGAGLAVPAGAQVIDARGLHVYPGMFNAFSRLGLQEVPIRNRSTAARSSPVN